MTDRSNPMNDGAVLVDSTVVLHSLGHAEPHRSRARAFLRELWSGTGRAYASTEMVQEVVFHRMRRTTRDQAVAEARDITRSLIVLNFDHEVLEMALALIEHSHVRGRDAVHAATALAFGIETIASSESAFDGVPGLRRLDPLNH